MSQPQITKKGIIKAEGAPAISKAYTRANSTYSFTHTDYTIGFVEQRGETAKIYDGAIEANQFYEI